VESYSPALFQGLVIAMVIALIVTVLLGVWMAFRTLRRKWTVWLALALGVLVPVVLLWLGRHG
jgi:hypothetical protein